MKRAKKGFTLVEVIVVLVIIAIVAAIAVPNISGYIKRSKTNNCQHTMNDFVNDLEYRIVSKRYYDVNELNNELVGLVEAVSDSRNADANVITSDGKFQRLEEKIKEAAGICPNGGQYTVEWTIKPGDDPNTAKVKIGKCECDCIDEHVQLSSSYEFTAALIDTSEYLKSGRAPEEIYETEIEKLVKKYNTDNSHLDPASVDDIVDKINENSEYKILGMTVSQNPKINGENNVEWMLVDHHEDYDANDPENKPGTHKFFVYYPSEDRMEIFEMSEEDYKDKKKWPPAEGNSGSYIYSEKLSYSNGQTYQVAGVDHPEMISWIQRDGDWYVEKTDYSKGIDDLENSRPENPEEHILISRKIPESITVESLLDSEALAPDTRNLMLINVSYKNETGTTKFLRMEASEDGSTVKNGFVIVSSEEEYRDKKWAGVYADSTSPEAIAELNTRKEILGKENTLVRDFFSGKTNKLVVAYQEYNKVYNKTTDRYEVKPVTCFSEIVMSQRADGVKEIKTGDEVIATIEAVPGKTSDYNIFFDSALLEGDVFRVEDLSIKRTAEYVIKNTNGDTVGKALVGEEIPHVSKAAEGEVGFFVNGNYPQTQPANYIYNKETEDNSVDHINHGNGQGFIYILDPSDKYNYEQIGRIETYEHGGYLEWNYDKEENDTEFDINKLTATVKYKVNVRDKSDTPVSTGWITYEYGHKTDADSYGFYFVTKNGDTSWNSDNDSRLYSELNDRYAAVEVRIDYCKYYNSDYPNRVNEHLCDIISYFDSVKATYTNDGSSFDFEKIKAEAGYRIALCHYYGQSPVYTIDHSVELSHDSEADNKFRYYMTMQHHDPSLQELQTQEYAFLSQLYGDYKGETFVAFNDKNIDGNKVTKKASIYVDSTSEINPPEVVYIPFSGTQDAYAVAYIGNSKAVTVEPSYEGYWSETAPDASVNSGFIKRTVNNKDYYYIDDRKTYNITRIGKDPDGDEYSFEFPKTDNITSFTVSSGVKEIGSGAFHNYGYKFKWGEAVIVLPDSVKKIGKNAFSGLNIGNIITGNISKSVADDGSVVKASGTSLLESIGDGSFSGTTLFACDAFVVPEKVTSIGTGAFTDFKIGNGGLFIDGVSDASEKSIAKDVFGGTVFGRLSFGPGVEKIESDAFKNNTSSAVLELGSVKSIGENAFNGWINANGDLIIPESVEKIGGFAFSDYASGQNNSANYHSLTINGGSFSDGTKLGGLIFTNGHFRDISIGGKVTDIDENAFSNAPLDGKMPYNELKGTLTLGSSISTIGTAAFKDCTGLNGNLDLPDRQLNEIGDSAFEGCFGFNGDLTVPDTVTRIGNSTFENCTGFTGNLDLGSSIQTIGSSAFKNCKGFKGDLVVPESVTNMGERAFDSYAAALTDSSKYPSLTVNAGDSNDGLNLGGLIFTNGHFRNVYVGGKITNIGDYAFDNESNEHSDFTGLLTIGNNVEVIGDYAFKKCTGFTGKLGFSENKVLNRIENEAFVDCTGFTGELDLPDSIQEIGSKAFENCTGFDGDIDLGSSLKTVGIEAFKNCTGFTGDLTVPESVTAMGKGAFENYAAALENSSRYPSLTVYAGHTENGTKLGPFIFTNAHFRNVHIGGKIKVIDDYAFSNSESNGSEPYSCFVGSLRIDGDVEKIGEEAFKQCTGFDESLYVGDSVKEIDNSAFREMHINELTGLSGVKRIGRYAFWKCDKIASDVTFEGNTSLERIEREAFYGTSSLGSLTIPPTVTFMGPYAFDNSGSGNGRLVIFGASRIENGKKYLGDNKYSGQPDSGGTLFNHARYRDVIIGGNVDVIGQYFMKSDFSRTDGSYDTNFDHHGITGSLTITGNVSEIEGEAFNDAGFDGTLTLNSSKLETIGYSAFENLPNMYGDITIPQTVHNIDRRAFKKFAMNAPDSKLGTLRIKGYSESNGNQHIIGYRLFSFARFKSVEIGGENSSVNTIGNFAFYNSSFETDSTFEDNQTKYEAFDSGSGYSEDDIKVYRHLKYDETKEGVKVNNDNSNYSSFTQELKILDGIETIGTRAFGDNHSILEVKLESSTLKTIGKDAFNRCTKAGGGLTIPKTVTSIGRCAFKQYGENTDNPGTLTVLGYSDSSSDGKTRYIGIPLNDINGDPKPIFPSAKFKDVVIGGTEEEATVNAIGDKFMNNMDPENNTYNYSGMTGSLTIGKSIKSVGREAFVLCTGFNGALTLNEGLTSIGENAFNACAGFHGDLLIPSTVSSIGTQAFKHFGQGSTASDANTGSLTILGYSSIKPAPDDSSRQLQTIDSLIFSHAHFTNVTIGGKGGNVQYIGENFMENETTETFNDEPVTRYNGVRGNLTIGEGVYRVGKNAFLKCKNFDGALKIADSVWQIGESAFNGCSGLYTRSDIDPDDRKLVISSHVTQIGDYAFKSVCENLNDNFPSLEIYGASGGEANMKSIGGPGKNGVVVKSIFANSRFNNVTIGEENGEVKMIGDGFMDNSNNEYSYITGDLVIGKSVTKIGANAFYKLESDESKSYNRGKLVLNEGLQSIGEKAFANTRFFGSPSLLGERREERVLKIPKTVTTIGSKAFENFCSDFVTKPRLIIEGYSENDNNKTLGKNIFPGASFENVTIGGSVRHIDGYAFMGSEYSDITGTLTIEEYTVGWVNGRYETLTNNAQLLWWALSSGWTGAGMSFDTDSRTGHGPFRGCNFFKARFPRSLYNSLNSYKDNIFNTKPSVKSWDSNNNIYYASPGFSFEYY